MRTIKRALVVTLLVIGAVALISALCLFYSYQGTRPKSAQPEIGRIYASNNHGSIVYLTKDEDSLLTYLEYGGLICWVVGIYLGNKFKISKDPLEGVPQDLRYKILHGKKDDPLN